MLLIYKNYLLFPRRIFCYSEALVNAAERGAHAPTGPAMEAKVDAAALPRQTWRTFLPAGAA